MKNELTGVVGSIVVALIHKGAFDKIPGMDSMRAEINKTIKSVEKAFE